MADRERFVAEINSMIAALEAEQSILIDRWLRRPNTGRPGHDFEQPRSGSHLGAGLRAIERLTEARLWLVESINGEEI